MFTSTYTDNVLRLEIDAAKRSGGWASAHAISALALKKIGSFSGVSMSSSTGAAWSLVSGDLGLRGCTEKIAKAATTGMTQLCYTGAGIALADNMVFTFTFTGAPALSAPYLKVHFVDASGNKLVNQLSLDFPWQAASIPVRNEAAGPGPVQPVSITDGTPSKVPEPRTLGLLAAGMTALAVARRRRK